MRVDDAECGLRASEHSLRKAFEWFHKKVAEQIKSAAGNRGMRLAQLMEDISDRLFFTVITVTDELNAYKVFETPMQHFALRFPRSAFAPRRLASSVDGQSSHSHLAHCSDERMMALP